MLRCPHDLIAVKPTREPRGSDWKSEETEDRMRIENERTKQTEQSHCVTWYIRDIVGSIISHQETDILYLILSGVAVALVY